MQNFYFSVAPHHTSTNRHRQTQTTTANNTTHNNNTHRPGTQTPTDSIQPAYRQYRQHTDSIQTAYREHTDSIQTANRQQTDTDTAVVWLLSAMLDHVVDIITPREMKYFGLKLVNYTSKTIRRSSDSTNIRRFVSHFGSTPMVLSIIYADLQTTQIASARVTGDKMNLRHFLIAMHALKRYPTEEERQAIFDISPHHGRDVVWFFVTRIQNLKVEKIKWPSDEECEGNTWIMSVDGTHCWIEEPIHPEFSQDRKFYSHKYNKAGLNYELGILLWESRLVWMQGPTRAGSNDVHNFVNGGLEGRLLLMGKKAIGDGGYYGHQAAISTPNVADPRNVGKFKSRALKRHEKFNGMIKCFDCLKGRFRHSIERFSCCFEAVCVICQYQMENGKPLYNILIEDIM